MNDAYTNKAAFLDRDGVINHDPGWIHRPDQLKVFPFAAEAIRALKEHGWLVVVVSNQSAVARGLCTERDVERVHEHLAQQLASDGARIDAFYFCPHHPDFGPEPGCRCRKPKTGMIDRAVQDFGIDVRRSFLVGDKTSDVAAGQRAGLRTILVQTGEAGQDGTCQAASNHVVADLCEAVELILSSTEHRETHAQ
jgi:histidinol-phosphate phosphatase family protein